jgi:hypothetical protein
MAFIIKNISITFFILIFILFSTPQARGETGLKLSSKNIKIIPEVTILYSIYTTKEDVKGINKENISSIINNQIPLKIEKEISNIFLDKEKIIIGFEKQEDKFNEIFLKDFGRGLKKEDFKNLMETKNIIIVGVKNKNNNFLSIAASMLAYAVAKECNGTIFDISTLECFNNSTFIKLRMKEEIGSLKSNIISRVCKPKNNIYRLVTRGMKKYGLPDISLYNLKKDYLIMGHLLLMGVAGKLYEDFKNKKFNKNQFKINGSDLKKMIKKNEKYPIEIKEDSILNYIFIEDQRGEFDDLNRIISIKSLSDEIKLIEKAKKTLFKYEQKEKFDYIATDDISTIAKKARKFIPKLIEEFKKNRVNEEFYCLIVPNIPMESDNLVWVKLIGVEKNGKLTGSVIPKQKTRTLSPGDNLVFSNYSIYDWIYMKNGETIGGDYLRRYMDYKKK